MHFVKYIKSVVNNIYIYYNYFMLMKICAEIHKLYMRYMNFTKCIDK